MSSTQIHRALWLLFLLGCGPQAQPQTGFWRGAWRVDDEALRQDEDLATLPPSARPLAEALIAELAPQIRFEINNTRFARSSPQGEVAVACEVVEERGVARIKLEGGRVLELHEMEEGEAILEEGGRRLPLTRVEGP